ncbi:MAG: homocysteine biosynthesis protein, partial [Syntrophobacteraceae bacterium]
IGVGVPIPILDEQILLNTCVTDSEIHAQVVDYSSSYPENVPGSIGEVTYAELKSGAIAVNGKKVPTSGLSSYARAREIAHILKSWIEEGRFFLTQPVETVPSVDSGVRFKPLSERPIEPPAGVPQKSGGLP